ncbi:MAG TPA: Gfo/Idh/MocA family oxidoreductase [Puia sp.]|nr:Gfo/Idh/MocA family oxidoreductase [Puia sp.]
MLNQVNWGMIGIGNVTEKKSAPAFNKVAHSRLVAVMGRDSVKAAGYAARHEVPVWYDQVDDLINDPLVNAVYIATPPDVHLEYARKVMQAGKPVYVEKPMARTAAECDEMNRISRETGSPLFVAYYRRALPYFVKLRELIGGKVIGDVRCINIRLHNPPYAEEVGENAKPRWRVYPEISGGGHFHDLASHQFDFLEYAFGPLKKAEGISRNQAGLYPADDCVMANFEFESGVLGNGSWCFTVNKEQKLDETQIFGSQGRIIFSFFDSYNITVEIGDTTQVYELPYPDHVQQPLIELIVKELTGGSERSPSTGISGGRASLILEKIVAGGNNPIVQDS